MMMSDSEYGSKGGGPGLLVYLNENGNDTRGLPVKDGEAEYMMQVGKLDYISTAHNSKRRIDWWKDWIPPKM
jgi:hypothetical protein